MNRQTTMGSEQSTEWGPHKISYWLVALISLFMLFLGVNTFIQPEAAIDGFGLPLHHSSDAAVIRIKADRDLVIGLIVAALLLLRMRKALLVILFVGTGMPLVDAWLVLGTHGTHKPDSVVHLVTVAYMLAVSWLLYREEHGQNKKDEQVLHKFEGRSRA